MKIISLFLLLFSFQIYGNIAHVNQKIYTPNPLGIAFSIIPGAVLHGSGHYLTGEKKTGIDLLIAEGISVGGIAAFGIPLALTANAGVLAPIILPGLFLSSGLFIATWALDTLGMTGLSHYLIEDCPLERSSISGGYMFQEDLQSPHHHFFNFKTHLTFKTFRNHYIDLNVDHAITGYNRTAFQYGYRLFNDSGLKLYLSPEFKYEQDQEGFSISTAIGYIHLDLNLNYLWPTMNHIYLISILGYGYQWYHFDGFHFNDSHNALLTVGQGIRIRFPHIGIESMILHQKDEQIGGSGVTLMIFKHTLTLHYKKLFLQFQGIHGQGYRIGTILGWTL